MNEQSFVQEAEPAWQELADMDAPLHPRLQEMKEGERAKVCGFSGPASKAGEAAGMIGSWQQVGF